MLGDIDKSFTKNFAFISITHSLHYTAEASAELLFLRRKATDILINKMLYAYVFVQPVSNLPYELSDSLESFIT